MKDQHKLIRGYRDLSAREIGMMNDIKDLGRELGELLEGIEKHLCDQAVAAYSQQNDGEPDEAERLAIARPFQWLEAGRHELQTALMKVTRAVAQPAAF